MKKNQIYERRSLSLGKLYLFIDNRIFWRKKTFKSENNENSIHSSFDLHFWHKKTFNIRNARNIYMYIHNVERKVFECLKDFYRKTNTEIFFLKSKRCWGIFKGFYQRRHLSQIWDVKYNVQLMLSAKRHGKYFFSFNSIFSLIIVQDFKQQLKYYQI